MSAAKLGDPATADAAAAQARQAARTGAGRSQCLRGAAARRARAGTGAIIRWAKGAKEEALALAKSAAEVELTMAAPSGPPDPIKPALELYGELLAEAGRDKEAVAAFEQSLLRMPNRTPSVKGLATVAARSRRRWSSAGAAAVVQRIRPRRPET
ncbi:MAG: hypothetical protein R2708_26865 [Vicinamibacterales bacterium]